MAGKDKVVSLRGGGVDLPPLRVASTSGTGNQQHGSRNDVWLCPAYSDGQGVMLYVKPRLNERALFTEVLAAQIGQCMGLPCPNPYLVTVNLGHVGGPRGKRVLSFGSEQVSQRSLARPIPNLDVLLRVLREFKIADATAVFDELIGNSVRSPSDILFDPQSGPHLVDHEGAMDPQLRPDVAATNWLAQQLVTATPVGDRGLLLRAFREKASDLHKLTLAPVPSAVQLSQNGMSIYRELLEFVRTRLLSLDALLSARVLPDQRYIDEPVNNERHDANGSASV